MKAQIEREKMSVQAQVSRETSGGSDNMKQMGEMLKEMHANASAPAEFVRGPDGRLAGVKRGNKTMKINRGPDGTPIGVQ
jgi:hypothetical protein